MRYRGFCDELRLRFNLSGIQVTGQIGLRFYLPAPERVMRDVRMKRAFFPVVHQEKPDVDNLVKAVLDALLDEDKGVYEIHAQKYYAPSRDKVGILLVFDEPLTDYEP